MNPVSGATTDPTKRVGHCKNCKQQVTAQLYIKPAASGAETFSWACGNCQRLDPFNTGLFISAKKVYEALTVPQIQSLPVLVIPLVARCAKCGSRHAELHHWAPRAIFGDEADEWPTDYLCVPCHDRWHEKVTPRFFNPDR